eukprot:m.74892 g.74892  ORF g.74892 m.74892 type:complete len:656 (+) comp14460_c0_seq2:182-2149(+)
MTLRHIVVALCVLATVAAGAKNKQPHILFVVADDLGYNDVGWHQNQRSSANPQGLPTTSAAAGIMRTPNLDRLASESQKLENYYVQPLCSPTRSTIMTGRYPISTGIGPDVIVIDTPYGVPARERFLPEILSDAGYRTAAVGKWHLGACNEKYLPTYRGFDSFLGYLAGSQGYYAQAGDRNGTGRGMLPHCMGSAFGHVYSSLLFVDEAVRIVECHPPAQPLFLYLAFQNVHNPYDVPPPSLVGNVNETYKAIVDYERRIYAGMLTALDIGVGNVTDAFKRAGLWDDTVFVFTTDNGGIGAGSNYPLRGQKVLNWEGGVKGAAFVRGTDTPVAPVPAGSVNTQLMHTTDWLPTLARLAGVDKEAMDKSPLPLDGHDQWDVIAHGAPTNRTFIAHNVPTGAKPVQLEDGSWTTSTCLSNVDNRTGPCHGFGMTGGALRKGSWKLLVTYPGKHPWGDSSPAGTPQILPGGRYPNGSHVFVPTTQNTVPQPYNNTLFLFDIDQDPTESHNLADTEAGKLDELLALYAELADRAVPVLSWIYGFRDPTSGHGEGGCTGPFVGSDYCAYGHEFDCWVQGTAITGYDVGHPPNPVDSPAACQQACAGSSNSGDDGDDIRSGACEFWSFDSVNNTCTFKSHVGHQTPSASTTYGPATCPHAT